MKRLSDLTCTRLTRLADRLDKVLPNHFYLGEWYQIPWQHAKGFTGFGEIKADVENEALLLDEGFCGSIACVLGHAALIKEFNDQGLYVDVSDVDSVAMKENPYAAGYRRGKVVFKVSEGKTLEEFYAGSAFFDLRSDHARMIFGGEGFHWFYDINPCGDDFGHVSPQMAASALRKYVETDGQWGDDCLAAKADHFRLINQERNNIES